MELSACEFDEKLASGTLHIALIGMSNIGKSHWARHLKHKYGFTHYEVDDRIQESLSLNSISSSAGWIGNPYNKRYASRSAIYLKLEGEMTLGADTSIGNLVLDTTGSVIHLNSDLLKQLKDKYLTVYLKAKDSDIDRLVQRFRTTPKPLIWGDHYKKKDGLSNRDSMIACYRDLLMARDKKYEALADITVQASSFSKDEDVMALFKAALPAH